MRKSPPGGESQQNSRMDDLWGSGPPNIYSCPVLHHPGSYWQRAGRRSTEMVCKDRVLRKPSPPGLRPRATVGLGHTHGAWGQVHVHEGLHFN